jgi:hypothetical protein
MDISNRKSLLLSLNKTANEATEQALHDMKHVNKTRYTLDERMDQMRRLRDQLRDKGNKTFSQEERAKLESYNELILNFWKGDYRPFVQKEMQAFGDDLAKKTVIPLFKQIGILEDGAEKEGQTIPNKEQRIEQATKSIKESSLEIEGLQKFSKTYDALIKNDLSKIACSSVARKDVSSAFLKELDNVLDIHHVKFAKEYGNSSLDLNNYNQFYELALAHHVLTQEGFVKEAQVIDDFVIKNAGLWDYVKGKASDAWEGAKRVVKTGVKYAKKAIVGIGKAVTEAAWWVGKTLLKGLRFLVSKLPFLGIIFSIPFAIKNTIEAYQNGKRLFDTMDINKFGFSKAKIILPGGLDHTRDAFKKAQTKFAEDPDALKELLTIFRTIGAFWIDCLYAVTNSFMAILDAIAIAGLFIPVVGWLASIGAMGGSFLLAIGVAGLEVGAEYFKDEYWEADEKEMEAFVKDQASKFLSEAGTHKTIDRKDLFEEITVDSSYRSSDIIITSEAA